ncbi:MAG: DUF5011 domain-containing protein [Bacilli bacterium]|nr:DUF5011 domain-containing protein [Bacilli bacterium]
MARRKKKNNGLNIFLVIILLFLIGVLCYKIYDDQFKNLKTNTNDKRIENKDNNNKTNKNTNNNEQKIDNKTNTTKSNTDVIEEKANEVTEKSSKNENTETKNEHKRRGGTVTLELIGEENVVVDKGSKYIDSGVKAMYSDGTDASNEVDVDNAVDTSKEGTYTVSYYAGNAVVIRRVTVR